MGWREEHGRTNGFDKWFFPQYSTNMPSTLSIDSAGRILIPKALREKLHLGPGDALQLESEDDQITLRPVRCEAELKKERGVWVYQGEPCDASLSDVIDRARENRIREFVK